MTIFETLPIIYLVVGSNIDPERHLAEALALLRGRFNVLAVSSVYQSPAFGFAQQPDFLDIVVKIATPLLPVIVKEKLEFIEKRLGRDRANQATKHGPLTLDMDILLWGDGDFSFGNKPWRVPHDSITKYAAVAIPLAEIAGDVIHPSEKVTISEIASRFTGAHGVSVRRDVVLE
ncbi:MAG: 2-amino-4-hydroxy-6-hydroxymethyldihydropteridine diphosphokinase [Phototrophicales bacterium]|nr:2-amino-4-hydroxy-6-hydroxymethyldihydropteridine diphosphokinase [Phototrophicales bacterium]